MREISENELNRVITHCQRYTDSLQFVSYERLGKFFHDGNHNPVELVYLCPICLVSKVGLLENYALHSNDIFTMDHFPPQSVGGKQAVLVCKTCNSKAGTDYDYSLKEWVQEQSFINSVPGSKLPAKIEFEGVVGRYRETMISDGRQYSFALDNFSRYPKVRDFFNRFPRVPFTMNIDVRSADIRLVYRAIIKSAYLQAFYIWGYDFIYTDTGMKMRDVFLNDKPHVLSNYGIFFYKDKFPPQGLCYVYTPVEFQTFMLNFKIIDMENRYAAGISVLIPGPSVEYWEGLRVYNAKINSQTAFQSNLIKLPEDILKKTHFPYTKTWSQRQSFVIEGFNT